eukprot:TRINITY_DN33244_c0_g1_i2.p1 TRINITY_DN33244_c0_g1~~TRINITY_DN33244_c0_g1_i2.p1  ORF type:complete len:114 (-),score=12.99 TRINITY_DN33244_c0_g1_i2:1058-1399(-)
MPIDPLFQQLYILTNNSYLPSAKKKIVKVVIKEVISPSCGVLKNLTNNVRKHKTLNHSPKNSFVKFCREVLLQNIPQKDYCMVLQKKNMSERERERERFITKALVFYQTKAKN